MLNVFEPFSSSHFSALVEYVRVTANAQALKTTVLSSYFSRVAKPVRGCCEERGCYHSFHFRITEERQQIYLAAKRIRVLIRIPVSHFVWNVG
jgi:hypothetical protein